MLRKAKTPFRRFADDTSGNMVMELLLVMPFFIWAILGIIIYFYGFHMKTLNTTGSNAITDYISRQQEGPVKESDIAGLDDVFAFLTKTPDQMSRLRVTIIECTENCDPDDSNRELDIQWSCPTDGLNPMSEADLSTIYDDQIPIIPENEPIIIVETQVLYRPPVWFGVFPRTMDSFIPSRPRFVDSLKIDADASGSCYVAEDDTSEGTGDGGNDDGND